MLVELFAAVQWIATCGPKLTDKQVLLFIDSEAVEGALVKGASSKEDVGDLVLLFWKLVRFHKVVIYIDRVSTDANISDGCSRGSRTLASQLGWIELEVVDPLGWGKMWVGPGRC